MDDEPVKKAMLPVTIKRTVVPMEVDTGAAATSNQREGAS